MRLQLRVIDSGDAADVLVEADPTTTVAAVAAEISAVLRRGEGDPGVLHLDGVPLDPQTSVWQSALRDASVVGFAPGGRAPSGGVAEVRFVAGTGAGRVVRLAPGVHDVEGLRVTVRRTGACEFTSATPVPLDGEETTGGDWPPGAQLALGDMLLEAHPVTRPDGALQASADGAGLDFYRPPRMVTPVAATRLSVPRKPTPSERQAFPLVVGLVLPLVMAFACVAIFKQYYYLMFALLSPISAIAMHFSNRKRGKGAYKRQLAEYEETRAAVRAKADEAVAAERAHRRAAQPDPAVTALTAEGPGRRLWERRRGDDDFLRLRAGTADRPAAVTIDDHDDEDAAPPLAADVPVTVPLAEHGVIGIAGTGLARDTARWLLAQAAAWHSPTDVRVYLLARGADEEEWGWLRWLPHTRDGEGEAQGLATVATDLDGIARRVAELASTVEMRRHVPGGPAIVVLIEDALRLRHMPGLVQVLRDGPSLDVHVICLAAEEKFLAEECRAIVTEQRDGTLAVQLPGEERLTGVRPDAIGRDWTERLGLALGPLRDGTPGAGEALPESVRLLDLLGMEHPEAADVLQRWRASGRGTEAVVGMSLDAPFTLDLRKDGPHGLIAGTTGAGKSELLQTLVASLATGNSPEALNFLLVDYKGGSAFTDCVRLPHTVGLVTDLDPHMVERALTSLKAELLRRERLFAAYEARDIEDYQRVANRPPLPRLVIVIDEFASLVRELPDFVTGLVNVAQRGRSLGLHLILATQRPAGVVSADIRANTNLRIALRVTDSSESQDIIDARDAAGIGLHTPGRAFVRAGQSSPLIPVQIARASGRRPEGARGVVAPTRVTVLPWRAVGSPPPRPETPPEGEVTDLTALVDAINAAARESLTGPPGTPWLPPLPDLLPLADLSAPGAWGLVDLPASQRQEPLVVDPSTMEHLHIVGSARSGRSEALRTLAGVLAAGHTSAELHLYGIDCGNGALLALADLPHTGAVVTRGQPDRVTRLVERLRTEVAHRQELCAAHGVPTVGELPPETRPARAFLLLDRWEVFTRTIGAEGNGEILDGVMALFREGAAVGVHVIAAGDQELLSGRYAPLAQEKLILRLQDRSDVTMIGLRPADLPKRWPAGRAIRASDGAEVQLAVLSGSADAAAQAAALKELAVPATVGGPRPMRFDPLPERLTVAEARVLRPATAGPLWTLVGVGGDELTAYGADLASVPTLLVAGPSRSGRSTALLAMAADLRASGIDVAVIAPKPSPLRDLAGRPGVLACVTDIAAQFSRLERAMESQRPLVVLADDAELLPRQEADDLLEGIAAGRHLGLRALIAGGTVDDLAGGYAAWQVHARRNRAAVLLSPQDLTAGELIGGRVNRQLIGGPIRPGRGLAALGEPEPRRLALPLATGED
ncbi:cell division protein FtsK [Actinorhabdospora filicis]|uniref:Cell division protein FtsK n=1 Tax=Actinorhabdospora filicis TaxID=1785913 RepID=A0A9W6SIG9_9ACTN|nr:FtsK/SpoIIIE domain-containing protein [Actinorhabdospora filicis]GLZ76442.1 cell division protein FtsK [Actinorhabdospora filicis]